MIHWTLNIVVTSLNRKRNLTIFKVNILIIMQRTRKIDKVEI